VLSASVDDELLQWDVPTATDGDSIAVNEASTMQIAARRRTGDDGGANPQTLPIRINAYSLEAEDDGEQSLEPSASSFYATTDIPARQPAETPLHLPARFTASGVSSDDVNADVTLIAHLGEPLVAKAARTGTGSVMPCMPTSVCRSADCHTNPTSERLNGFCPGGTQAVC